MISEASLPSEPRGKPPPGVNGAPQPVTMCGEPARASWANGIWSLLLSKANDYICKRQLQGVRVSGTLSVR
eukprot:1967732-Pyramimonas_sp.AAC.1